MNRFYQTLLLVVCLFASIHAAQAQCTLACNNQVNISLGSDCEATITYDLILEGGDNPAVCTPFGPGAYMVFVMQNNEVIPNNPVVDESYIGQTLQVKVKHWATGTTCWGSILIEDKLAPVLTCPADVTLPCTGDTSPGVTGMATATDCSDLTITFSDQVQNFGCAPGVSQVVTRTFIATDQGGFSSSCEQTITLTAPTAADIEFPEDLDGFDNPALNCAANPSTDPGATGRPTIGGVEVDSNTPCPVSFSSSDQIINTCEGGFKILRTWTVVLYCTGQVLTDVQIIKVEDTTAPLIACPPAITTGTTSADACTGSIFLPPATVSDVCSPSGLSVRVFTPFGVINGNGGALLDVPIGTHTLTYEARDGCNNVATCQTTLTVVDDDAPTVICDEFTTITLTNQGIADIPAEVFDDGSFDNCCGLDFDVRRMAPACGQSTAFGPTVRFCCADAGQTVEVEMRATDCFGNANSCMVFVTVENNILPVLSCPADMTLSCDTDLSNLALTGGMATATSSCGAASVVFSDVESVNMCGVGTVTRTFSVPGTNVSCSQTLTLIDNTPFSVNFPNDYSVTGCADIEDLDPEDLPTPFAFPQYVNEDCEMLSYSHSDQVFTNDGTACLKIVRTWKVINMCEFVPGTNLGTTTDIQIIEVIDNVAPTFTCPQDFTVAITGTDCTATVQLPQITDADDCTVNPIVAVSGDFGSGTGPFTNVAVGTYDVFYTVFDNCGNSSSCAIEVTVVDTKKPSPVCMNGLVIGIMQTGMIEVTVDQFDAGSFDNCGPVNLSFSTDPDDDTRLFTCAELGAQPITLYATDGFGNQDFCSTFVNIQDNMGVCAGDPLVGMIAGTITDEMGSGVAEVMIDISNSGLTGQMVDASGHYSFDDVPMDGDYTVLPNKDINAGNGVSTIDIVMMQRHILGSHLLDSPYKIIAADVNGSGDITSLDMIAARRMVLQLDAAFPNNVPAWRFVNAGYAFLDPTDPLNENFPQVYNINNFDGDALNVNFIAVKMGDLNASALTGQLDHTATEDRNRETALQTPEQYFEAGTLLEVPLSLDQPVVGLQTGLHFDPSRLQFLGAEGTTYRSEQLNDRGASEGLLLLSQVFEEEITESITLRFRALESGRLSQVLALDENLLLPETYTETLATRSLRLQFGTTPIDRFVVHAPSPNPFKDVAFLKFDLPRADRVRIEFFDAQGRAVVRHSAQYEAGSQQIRLRYDQFPASGTYLYRVTYGDESTSGRLVLTR